MYIIDKRKFGFSEYPPESGYRLIENKKRLVK